MYKLSNCLSTYEHIPSPRYSSLIPISLIVNFLSSFIDSSEYRCQSGNDLYLSRIIKGALDVEDITAIAQAHRKMRDTFIDDPAIGVKF